MKVKKKLFEEVMGFDVKKIRHIGNKIMFTPFGDESVREIPICKCDFVFIKCKAWAYRNDFDLSSSIGWAQLEDQDAHIHKIVEGKFSEMTAILRICEWLHENLNKKEK